MRVVLRRNLTRQRAANLEHAAKETRREAAHAGGYSLEVLHGITVVPSYRSLGVGSRHRFLWSVLLFERLVLVPFFHPLGIPKFDVPPSDVQPRGARVEVQQRALPLLLRLLLRRHRRTPGQVFPSFRVRPRLLVQSFEVILRVSHQRVHDPVHLLVGILRVVLEVVGLGSSQGADLLGREVVQRVPERPADGPGDERP